MWFKPKKENYQNLTGKMILGQKIGFCKVLINVFKGQTKVFLGSKGHIWTETIEEKKNKKIIRFSHTKALL